MTSITQSAVETARYKIFLNQADQHVLVLQFPHLDRERPFTEARGSKPLQVRVKPKSGLVEVDVPLPDVRHVNPQIAVKFGQSLLHHKKTTNNAPVGIAGGFGASNPVRVKRDNNDREREEALVADFGQAVASGKALNYLTLTGQINPPDPADPTCFLGNFHGNELHLTKVSAFCSLSVGLNHLDAEDLNEKARRRAAQEEDHPTEKAAIVSMQVKSAEENKTEESEWKRVLRELQEEPWEKLDWIDEAEDESFEVFHESLFLGEKDKSDRIMAIMSKQQYSDAMSASHLLPSAGDGSGGSSEAAKHFYFDPMEDDGDGGDPMRP